MIVWIALALLGAVSIAAGAAHWDLSVGLVVSGVEAITAAYIGAYLSVKRKAARR